MTTESYPERAWAVDLMRRLDTWRDLATGGPIQRTLQRLRGGPAWPVVSGAYAVADPTAPVAVCTLTSNDLVRPVAALSGVAIAGRLYTPNLGIEKIVLNVTANPHIRFLLLVGRESPVFHPADALRRLLADGVDAEMRIVGARGHRPVLSNVPLAQVEAFRRQVEVVDCVGETSAEAIAARVDALAARSPGPFAEALDRTRVVPIHRHTGEGEEDPRFLPIRPGGKREPLSYDPKGFFVVTVNQAAGEIVLRHYLPDNAPAHVMRGRTAESMLLGLIREGLVSQLGHAGYLGVELAKAETALRLGWRYDQEQPLRP